MKNNFKTLLLLAAISFMSLGNANSANATLDENIVVSFPNVKPGQELFIKNANGKIIHQETITNSGSFSKTFELADLPNGLYSVELEKDYEIQVIPFSVAAHKVQLMEDSSYTFFKPVVRSKGDLLYISKLSFDEKPLKVKVYYDETAYNGSYELLFSETLEDKTVLERIYKLKNSEKGNYKVVLSTNDRTFTKIFKI